MLYSTVYCADMYHYLRDGKTVVYWMRVITGTTCLICDWFASLRARKVCLSLRNYHVSPVTHGRAKLKDHSSTGHESIASWAIVATPFLIDEYSLLEWWWVRPLHSCFSHWCSWDSISWRSIFPSRGESGSLSRLALSRFYRNHFPCFIHGFAHSDANVWFEEMISISLWSGRYESYSTRNG